MIWISVFFSALLIIQFGVLWILVKKNWKNHSKAKAGEFPMVSVLVAARNEEENLPGLLKSLSELDYPLEKLEILFADDQSEDQTPDLIQIWAEGYPNRKLISILPDQTKLFHPNGKANALAILAKQAKGELFFFTDADCQVPRAWIKEAVSCFEKGLGILIGITQVRSKGLFSRMQELDWWNTLGMVKVVTDLGYATTGLGNNMIISREAYEKSGGFEGLPFSLTEDLEISRSVRKAGYRLVHQVNPQLLVITKAEANWKDLLRQRKRWMNGVMSLSPGWKILLGIQFLFFPAVGYILVKHLFLGLGVWLLKIIFQGVFLSQIASRAGQKLKLISLSVFDFYQILAISLTILYYFWPVQTQWKARNYP
ncbi:glycosyltransferase [Algoriphagus sp. AK58]|uniref:glycosyltransferase n=1 Tax=Algoriphagus sp. AK58 TaxID=1406877 RepID=UPI0016503D0F|nr:glycosyltransferase [Algoriphagus sp. AK58]MBC6368361.1 glycosyl transferase [Algoriphagus sp. AK58]